LAAVRSSSEPPLKNAFTIQKPHELRLPKGSYHFPFILEPWEKSSVFHGSFSIANFCFSFTSGIRMGRCGTHAKHRTAASLVGVEKLVWQTLRKKHMRP
jgi:hypothetical protein